MKYYIKNYFTDEIIDVVSSFDEAFKICNEHVGSQVTLDDEVLYTNIDDLPF